MLIRCCLMRGYKSVLDDSTTALILWLSLDAFLCWPQYVTRTYYHTQSPVKINYSDFTALHTQ